MPPPVASTAEQISPISTKPAKQPTATAKAASSSAFVSAHHNVSNTLPQLKQKTGIVKSKVPPPVPPRGSPKERRAGNQQPHLAAGSTSNRYKMATGGDAAYVRDDKNAGSQNVNNPSTSSFCLRPTPVIAQDCDDRIDFYTDPDGLEIVPKFGERRSPSCVDDWLELNQLHTAQTTNPNQIRIKTQCLQREISFPAVKPLATVPSMIQSFSSPSIRPNLKQSVYAIESSNQNCLELDDLRKASSVSKLLATTFRDETQKPYTPKTHNSPIMGKRITKRRAPRPDQTVVHQRCT